MAMSALSNCNLKTDEFVALLWSRSEKEEGVLPMLAVVKEDGWETSERKGDRRSTYRL
jgi:hypothetical protein